MKKFIPDFVAILAFIILSFAYFFPAVIEDRALFQHDTVAGAGAGQEVHAYREQTGERSRWTNSLFGGMPTYQISPSYDSTESLRTAEKVYHLFLPKYVWLTFIMMFGFYILLRAFGFSPWLSGLGGVLWGQACPARLIKISNFPSPRRDVKRGWSFKSNSPKV